MKLWGAYTLPIIFCRQTAFLSELLSPKTTISKKFRSTSN